MIYFIENKYCHVMSDLCNKDITDLLKTNGKSPLLLSYMNISFQFIFAIQRQ